MTWHCKASGAYDETSTEAIENIQEIASLLKARGWTTNAICGLLGNIAQESGYNPWRWQSDNIQPTTNSPWTVHGYGLVQFTPAGNYINSNTAKGYSGYGPNFSNQTGDTEDGRAQLLLVDSNALGGYIKTSTYNLTFAQYKASTANADYLAEAWLYNFERPADPSATIEARKASALYCYSVLTGSAQTYDIQGAYNWAVNKCNADNVGYSLTYRNGQIKDGIQYYDCSSFIYYALVEGGAWNLPAYNGSSNKAFVTGQMPTALLNYGFEEVDINGEWKPGDIVWRSEHTEMVYSGGTGGGVTMGAHSSKYTLANQVSINSFRYTASSWTKLFRYTGGSVSTKEYSVSVTRVGSGSAWATPASGETGDTITLHATPYSGYEFTGWSVISGGVTITDNTFIMGTENVSVQATFTGETPVVPPSTEFRLFALFKPKLKRYKRA